MEFIVVIDVQQIEVQVRDPCTLTISYRKQIERQHSCHKGTGIL